MLDNRYFFPCVLQSVAKDDYKVHAYFNDGSVHEFDVKPLIKPGTVFEILSDINIFKSKITVINDTVAWDINGDRDPYNCIDIDPVTIFNAPIATDAL